MAYINFLDARLRKASEYPIGTGIVPPQFKNTTRDLAECSVDMTERLRRNAVIRSLSEEMAARCATH